MNRKVISVQVHQPLFVKGIGDLTRTNTVAVENLPGLEMTYTEHGIMCEFKDRKTQRLIEFVIPLPNAGVVVFAPLSKPPLKVLPTPNSPVETPDSTSA